MNFRFQRCQFYFKILYLYLKCIRTKQTNAESVFANQIFLLKHSEIDGRKMIKLLKFIAEQWRSMIFELGQLILTIFFLLVFSMLFYFKR